MDTLTLITFFSLFSAICALTVSLISLKRSNIRLVNSKLSRTAAQHDTELAEIHAVVASLAQQLKRQNARLNMRRAREKKQSNGESMTDDEWRSWATKQVELGNRKF